ncbi:MAG: metal-dependent hydrolase [Firmicutes bacterium]|nr:metal-dependent hydrolase [Bacillota bacterium]
MKLDRTIFYPHMSGGQPKDNGKIDDIKVLDVYEKNDEIIHVLEDNIIGDTVNMTINWKVRFDHMQQHTGQHILSTAFIKILNANTLSFHLGKEYSYIDIGLSSISYNDLRKVERFANEIVFSNFNIKNYIIDKAEINSIPLRKKPSVDKNIRIIEIDSLDYSPCGGTHHHSTGEVGLIKIRKTEKHKGNTRIEFVCGNRALKDYRWKNSYINKISTLLSSKDFDVYENTEKIFNENLKLNKQIKELNNELLDYKIQYIYDNASSYNNIKIINKLYEKSDFNDLRYIASNIVNKRNVVILFGVRNQNKCQILLAQSDDLNIDIEKIFNSMIKIINGSGGGNSKIIQGGGTKIDNLEYCLKTGLNLIKIDIDSNKNK